MSPPNENPAPLGGGNRADMKGLTTTFNYRPVAPNANEIAAAIVAERFHLNPCMARVVVELSSLGGQLS